jgi:hypothetical protein
MANFLGSLFGSKKATQQPATALRVNTSLQGVPIAITLGGANRLGGNLIDYYNFNYQNAPTSGSSSGGGKGGVFSGGSGKGNSGQYNYFTSFIIAVCEGPITSIGNVWQNGAVVGVPPVGSEAIFFQNGLGYTTEMFLGDYVQLPWGYTEAVNPARALSYRGIVYAGFGNFPLGSSTSLPNLTFEVNSTNNTAIPGVSDGDVSVAWTSWLTNPHWGVGFPTSRMGNLSSWQSYALSLGLVVSPVIASPIVASSLCVDLTNATNAEPCWQDGLLTVVPYGDTPVALGQITTTTETHIVPNTSYPIIQVGNIGTFAGDLGVSYSGGAALVPVTLYAPSGVALLGSPGPGQYYEFGGNYYFNVSDANQTITITYNWAASAAYTPDTTPLYDFTLDDFLINQGSIGQGVSSENSPLMIVRKSRDQMLNNIKLRYLDRNNTYNPVVIEVKDEASIIAFGRERPSDVKQFDFFCLASAAQQSATLMLIREGVARTFQWTCGRHFLLILSLMKIVTVTDAGQGLFRQGVRIKEIQENNDSSLTITAEEFLGTVSAPLYGTQASNAFVINDNADPGSINAPIIFEPTDELGGGLQVWAAVSGQNPSIWGGCFCWVSYDNQNFTRLSDPIIGAARMGVLTADFPAVAVNPVGPTIDQANTISVNLTESLGTLGASTPLDSLALNTRSYVGGEIVSYASAVLTAPNRYNLSSYVTRGAYGSTISDHPVGTPFARLDSNIFEASYDQSRIGSTVYLKFQSFNIYQGGLQNLANVPAYPFVLTGLALSSPLPNVANLRTVYDVNSGFTELAWDEVTDFRPLRYEVRTGTSPTSAATLGTPAHPPFRVPGDGEYWVAAVSQPTAGLTVYSQTWQSVTIAGAVITQNVMLTVDLQALNWPGVFTGGAGIDNSLNAIRTGGGNILTDANILTTPDILNYGAGTSLSGTYYPDDHAYLDIGYVANASISIKYQPTGIPIGQNILAIGNILTTPDILGSASTQFIDNYPLIRTGAVAGGDLYGLGDLYQIQYQDLYVEATASWGPWQRFSPGTYQARFFDFAFLLSTIDPNTISYDLQFKITITIPSRVDTYASTTSASADSTITFNPTGAAAAPFNGGAGPSNLPAVTWGIVNAQAGDDFIITALSLSAISFKILNGGSRVVRNLNLFAEGF